MIHIKSVILSLILSLFVTVLKAQIGIGNTNPQGALDITGTNNGLLIPRVALVNLATVSVITPTESELVYNTTSNAELTPGYYYLSSATGPWVRIGGATGWLTTGNADIVNGTNFMGTTNNVDVAFRRNNVASGRLAETSTSFGLGALSSTTAGENAAFGNNALLVNTGIQNVAVGFNALNVNTIGSGNVAIGYRALVSNTNSLGNIAIGHNAMATIPNATFVENVAIGWGSMADANAGTRNTFMGAQAGRRNTGNHSVGIGRQALGSNNGGPSSGIDNVAIGHQALSFNTSGQQNSVVGAEAMPTSTSGSNNSAFGYRAAHSVTTGNENTAIGYRAGSSTTSGSGNVFIGYFAGQAEAATSSNKLYISNSASNATTSLIYGEFGPSRILRTNSLFQIGDPTGTGYQFPIARGANNQVLQTNATGVLNWVDTSSLDVTEVDPQISSATINAVPKWNGTTLVDGIITDDGTNVTISGNTITSNFQMTSGANANYILQSDAAGNATWVPITNPLATLSVTRVNLSLSQTLTDVGWQKLNFNSIILDTNTEFAGGAFTASNPGIYQVNAGFHTNDQSNLQFYSIGVYVNGSLYQQTSGNHFNNGPVSRNINCMVNLASGNTVEIYVENYIPGAQIDSFPTKTFFEVQRIR